MNPMNSQEVTDTPGLVRSVEIGDETGVIKAIIMG